ncbi:hypothetical protein LCGC14_0560480 [marine sediment metagenome]|uniref:Uncharacterized protein n=1 Tax=marine sediment metagenome TaxID=412755 RepID=A0A0F9RS97_9ZZZZ|nr:hypothetical protein [Methylophaga sp.]HEC59333.1 hypothetical protein [Methylophaga sp.]
MTSQYTPLSTKSSVFKKHRFWLAGPVTLAVSIFIMAAMSLWFPPGIAGVNNLVFPLILFPLIWAISFFYSVLEVNIKRAWIVLMLVLSVNAIPVIASMKGWLS